MKKLFHLIGAIGFFVAVYGVISAVLYSNVIWYTYFVIGALSF